MARTEFDWMRDIQDVTNRFKEYFENFERPEQKGGRGERVAQVPYDLYVEDSKIYVEVDLPGMKKENIRITMAGDSVEVSGDRKPLRGEGSRLLHGNRRYGQFSCQIRLPKEAELDLANTSATYTDGVLRIVFPQAGKGLGFSIPVE